MYKHVQFQREDAFISRWNSPSGARIISIKNLQINLCLKTFFNVSFVCLPHFSEDKPFTCQLLILARLHCYSGIINFTVFMSLPFHSMMDHYCNQPRRWKAGAFRKAYIFWHWWPSTFFFLLYLNWINQYTNGLCLAIWASSIQLIRLCLGRPAVFIKQELFMLAEQKQETQLLIIW